MAKFVPQKIGLKYGEQGDDVKLLKRYLHRFGHWKKAKGSSLKTDLFDDATLASLERYQEFYGLEVTGEFDGATVASVQERRCGVPDALAFALTFKKWNKPNLTYSVGAGNLPQDLTIVQIREAVKEAFDLWGNAVALTFTEIFPPASADIPLSFELTNHGDFVNFDGVGNVVGHAFPPPPGNEPFAGAVHFDSTEPWGIETPSLSTKIDLVTVATHEIGHALGLDHSSVPNALMFPSYRGDHRFLSDDDIMGIRIIYA